MVWYKAWSAKLIATACWPHRARSDKIMLTSAFVTKVGDLIVTQIVQNWQKHYANARLTGRDLKNEP